MRPALKARVPLEKPRPRGMLPRKILKNRVFLTPENKILEILGILMKQNLNRKNARLLNKNCPIN